MKAPRAILVTGSRRKRRSIRGENWLEPNCTASSSTEKTKPVKVIIPPAIAPRIDSAAPDPKWSPIVVLVPSSTLGRTTPRPMARARKRPGTTHRLLRTYS